MRRHNENDLLKAADMWKAGKTWRDIAPFLGVKKRRFTELCCRRRDLFPTKLNQTRAVDIKRASTLWWGGMTVNDMCGVLGVTREVLRMTVLADADNFPQRWRTKDGFTFKAPSSEGKRQRAVTKPVVHEDRMKWMTAEGAVVTLPRISFIECPRWTG